MKSVLNLRTFFFAAIFILSALLNFYQLDKNPPGLYIDEVSIGVNAYSILKTGRDEHDVKFPLYFKSYGDYKLPVYIYLTSASMSVFGKNEFAVRFPSAFLGTLSIIFLYLLVTEISSQRKFSLLSIFLLSVSPWFMHFVGPAFEATAALFFFILGLYLYILFKKNHGVFFLLISFLSFVITFYTYNGYKIIAPIIFLTVGIDLLKSKFFARKKSIYYLIAVIPLVTIFHSALSNPSNERFFQTSAFADISVNNLLLFLNNYISYFSTDFLFNFGDGINRHQFLNFGNLSRWTLPFLLVGLFSLLKNRRSYLKFITLGLLILAPIPASLAAPSPHSLRALLLVIPFMLLTSSGIIFAQNMFKRYSMFMILGITMIFIYEFSIYLHFGFFHYPKTASMDWGGNYKEVVQRVTMLSAKYPDIVVLDNFAYTPEYFLFYNDSLKPLVINSGWNKKEIAGEKPVLLITKDFGKEYPPSPKLIDTVYLPNDNKDIFAQFWEL